MARGSFQEKKNVLVKVRPVVFLRSQALWWTMPLGTYWWHQVPERQDPAGAVLHSLCWVMRRLGGGGRKPLGKLSLSIPLRQAAGGSDHLRQPRG